MSNVAPITPSHTAAKSAEALQHVLADTFALYFKTHSYHWNVEGPHFASLHTLFEQQYTDMWQATDELAERLRFLGEYAPWNYTEMTQGTSINDTNKITNAEDMLKSLIDGHQTIAKSIQASLKVIQEAEDEVSTDLLIGRLNFHEKALWMLRSLSK